MPLVNLNFGLLNSWMLDVSDQLSTDECIGHFRLAVEEVWVKVDVLAEQSGCWTHWRNYLEFRLVMADWRVLISENRLCSPNHLVVNLLTCHCFKVGGCLFVNKKLLLVPEI